RRTRPDGRRVRRPGQRVDRRRRPPRAALPGGGVPHRPGLRGGLLPGDQRAGAAGLHRRGVQHAHVQVGRGPLRGGLRSLRGAPHRRRPGRAGAGGRAGAPGAAGGRGRTAEPLCGEAAPPPPGGSDAPPADPRREAAERRRLAGLGLPGRPAKPLRVWLDPDHGPALSALPFDLVWATTWEEEANAFVAPLLGLPELPFIAWPEPRPEPGGGVLWQTPGIVAWAQGRAFE